MPDLKDILIEILNRQNQVGAGQTELFAQLAALRSTLHVLDARSDLLFEQFLQTSHDTFSKERAHIQAELELLQATVSRMVQ